MGEREIRESVARAICCAHHGDENPIPVPDALMPPLWSADRENYLAMADAALAEIERLDRAARTQGEE